MGATAESLCNRYESLLALHYDHKEQIARLQQQALDVLIPELHEELDLTEQHVERAKAYLHDEITVWRFLRRSRFDEDHAIELLRNNLKWRLSASLDLLSANSTDPLYTENPVFYFHPRIVDRFGRPAAILNLKHVKRTADGSLDSFKEFIALGCEVARRFLSELTRKRGEDQDPVLQLILLVDLAGAGMSNLEIELLPFLLDLLKSHFPSMAGAMFILNFGWAYAGMWAVAKRVLPQQAIDRILFPSKDEMLEFFDENALPQEYGGSLMYRYTFKGSVLSRLGRPLFFASPSASKDTSPHGSRTPSRKSSYDSLADVYHSTTASPRSSRPGTPSGTRHGSYLSMTSLASAVEENERKTNARPLQRQTSSQDFRRYPLGQQVGESSSESDISDEEAVQRNVKRHRTEHRAQPSFEIGVSSGDVSPVYHMSPQKDLQNGSVPSIRVTGEDRAPTSPFSAQNPYWGYKPGRDGRRRKRDLLRSLSYLFFLRLLALRRTIEAEFSALFEYFYKSLRGIGLLSPPPPPPTPPSEAERYARRRKRRKAVTFDITEEDEDDPDKRSHKKRVSRVLRASSPSTARRRAAATTNRYVTLRIALTIVAFLILFRNGRVMNFLRGGKAGGRRATLRSGVRRLFPAA